MALEAVGYHCTHISSVDSILKNGYNESSSEEWLGRGIYFFCDHAESNGYHEANKYAKRVKKFDVWKVLQSKIVSENPLDLIKDDDARNEFKKLRTELNDKHNSSRKLYSKFSDQVVFAYLDEKGVFDVYIAKINSSRLYYKSFVIIDEHVQICVKDKNCIQCTEVIREEKV
jgi:hypothetical protein